MATRRWKGKAKVVRQVNTITVAGTWAQNDTVTITVDGVPLVITIGTLVTTTQVATTITQAFNGSTLTDTSASSTPTIADGGGQDINQLDEIAATSSSNVVTLTGGQTGDEDKPFTVTVSEVTAGDGTATGATPTAATGPHHFSDADNWTGDAVPVDNDDIIYDQGAVSCKYNISPTIQPASVTKMKSYTGQIGLADVNEDNPDKPYSEYRTKYLTFDSNAVTTTYDIERGEGTGSTLVRIDAGAGQVLWNQYGAGTRLKTGQPACLFIGTNASNVFNVTAGDLGIAWLDDESAHVATLRCGGVGQIGEPTVYLGDGADIANASIDVSSGTTEINSATGTGTIVVSETGVLTIGGTGAHASITIKPGGTVNYNSSGTITTLAVHSGATFDRSGDLRACTITNVVNLYAGAAFRDPHATVTASNGYKANGYNPFDPTYLDFGADRTVTLS